jgi:hypothetical protein
MVTSAGDRGADLVRRLCSTDRAKRSNKDGRRAFGCVERTGKLLHRRAKGEKVEPLQNPLWFKLDGKFFQMLTAGKREFLKGQIPSDDKAVLEAHEKWESEYLMDLIGHKFEVKTAWIKLANGHDALAWSYDMPTIDERQTVLRQLYLTTVEGEHVFGLNVPFEPGDNEKQLWQLLTDTANTLKPSDKALKLEDASRMVKGN